MFLGKKLYLIVLSSPRCINEKGELLEGRTRYPGYKEVQFSSLPEFPQKISPKIFHLPFGQVEGKIHYPRAIGHQLLCTLVPVQGYSKSVPGYFQMEYKEIHFILFTLPFTLPSFWSLPPSKLNETLEWVSANLKLRDNPAMD